MRTVALALLLAAPSSAAPKAPEFKIAKVLNAPVVEIKSLASLKGKVVYLEFWATWCGPCVAGIPRSNRIIEALKGEPFVFLAVTDEPADKIAAYMKTHEMKAWVGIDEAKSSVKAYKNLGRPDGYLIGKDGALLARIFPDHLQESEVRDAIAGRFVPKPVAFADEDGPEAARPKGKAFFELEVSSASGKGALTLGDDGIEGNGLPFAFMLSYIWNVEEEQFLIDEKPVETFAFRLKTTRAGFEKGREALKLAVESALGFVVVPELKEADAYLLSLSTEPGASRPQAAEPGMKSRIMGSGAGRLFGKATMPGFAKALWGGARRPVIDDTGLTGEYFLDLEWNGNDAAALDRALAATGLRLVPARRQVEFLRVVPAKKN